MNQREDACTADREDRHRFSGTVHRGSPLLPEQEQHRGNQRASVTNPDPEDEVGDVKSPADRLIESPSADANSELIPHGRDPDEQRSQGR